MDLHNHLVDKAGDKSWEDIALIARDLEIRIENEDEEARQLERKMRAIKQVLYETITHPDKMRHLGSKFYVRLSGVLEDMEARLSLYRADKHEFILFLKMLMAKMRREKLIVTRVVERKAEFGKHKGSPEAGEGRR